MPRTSRAGNGDAIAIVGGLGVLLSELMQDIRGAMDAIDGLDDRTRSASFIPLQRNISRGERFADEFLAYGERQHLVTEDIDIGSWLQAFATLLRSMLDRAFEIHVDVSQHCPHCLADPRALEHALLHLVFHGRGSMPGGGRLGLSANRVRLANGNSGVSISVSCSSAAGPTEPLQSGLDDPSTARMLGLGSARGFARQTGGSLKALSVSCGTSMTPLLPKVPSG